MASEQEGEQVTSNPVVRTPTHRCVVCQALWVQWADGTWSLISKKCGPCCDNAPMGAQIETFSVQARRVAFVCIGYQDGFEHGLKADGVTNPFEAHIDEWVAYDLGYEAGLKARAHEEPRT